MNPVIQQRLRRATPLALSVYVGLPVLFFLAVTGIGAAYALSGPDRPFNWPALLFPVVAIVIGLMAWRGQRTRPASVVLGYGAEPPERVAEGVGLLARAIRGR